MGYQVLARKWRPHNLQEMVGQEHILRMLTNALENNRLHHAYLFTGTRGVGKTTLARILAKCLNCEGGISAQPCGKCQACIAIDNNKFPDLIEVDAASRTKVEDTRDLLETIQYAPAQGRFKICLIDEVHMLSGHSFNALLKTLEEPPSHVIFLLATTDPHKLPATILSRCLQFNLNHVPIDKITARLTFICQAENISAEPAALLQIATNARGSLRDALSLLDQAIAWCPTNISLKDTNAMLGSVNSDLILNLLNCIALNDGNKLLNTIEQVTEQAPDIDRLLAELLTLLHQINIQQIIPEQKNSNELQEIAEKFSASDIQLFYQIALIGRRDLTFAPSPQLGFEMTMLRMLAFQPTTNNEQPTRQIQKEINPEEIKTAEAKENTDTKNNIIAPISEQKNILNNLANNNCNNQDWNSILAALKLSGMSSALVANCTLKNISEHKIELLLAEKHAALLTEKLKERVQDALIAYLKQPIKLIITLTTDSLPTPAKEKKQEQQKRHEAATVALEQDQGIKKIIATFNAKLDDQSIEAVDPI